MLNIICAVGKNREIGKNNKLLWNIPDDLKHFKEITQNHPVIMGLNTYYSIGRALPNRINIILSKEKIDIAGCFVFTNLSDAIEFANSKDSEVFIIGGGSVYAQAIEIADKLYLTIVDDEVSDADVFFPDYSEFDKVLKEENFETDNLKYKFVELVRGEK